MNNKRIVATTILTGASLHFSAFATENTGESAALTPHLDLSDHEIHTKSSINEVSRTGGLLGSGMCCADCRDLKLVE